MKTVKISSEYRLRQATAEAWIDEAGRFVIVARNLAVNRLIHPERYKDGGAEEDEGIAPRFGSSEILGSGVVMSTKNPRGKIRGKTDQSHSIRELEFAKRRILRGKRTLTFHLAGDDSPEAFEQVLDSFLDFSGGDASVE